jgi:hypothetical protein
MKMLRMVFLSLGGFLAGFLIGYWMEGQHQLDHARRQAIAIDFMCAPQQHWKGVKMFCGQYPSDREAK